jgi:hypothetical protein
MFDSRGLGARFPGQDQPDSGDMVYPSRHERFMEARPALLFKSIIVAGKQFFAEIIDKNLDNIPKS